MNGLSLLFTLAALGITAQMELGPSGQPTYTIRIESVLLEQLRQGESFRTEVAPSDRQARRFRILVSPELNNRGANPSRPGGDFGSTSESLVEYEAVQLENNEVEMWVQIAPERIETLAAGKAIEGEIPAEVREIRRYSIFVGVNLLPRQQGSAAAPSADPPFLLPNADRRLAPAAAEGRNGLDQSRWAGNPGRTMSAGTNSSLGSINGAAQGNGTGVLNNSGFVPAATNDIRTAWRNGPDQSAVAPPPTNQYSAASQPGALGPPPNGFSGDNRYGATANRFDQQYSQPAYNERAAPNGFANNPGFPNPQAGGVPNNTGLSGYPLPQATLASRPESPPQVNSQVGATAPPLNAAAGGNSWIPSNMLNTSVPSVQSAPAAAPAGFTRNSDGEGRSSSVPLILTTLALFTSLGVNSYLGWLAWSFFWRYRDAVNESVRARSYNAPSRQAA